MAKGRAIIAFTLIVLCLMASSVVYLKPVKSQYQGDITINADGSVNPSLAPIIQSGNKYTLSSDINGSITVNRSNIVLEGKHTISGSSVFSAGITLNNTSNCTVTDFSITSGQFGISVYGTHNVVANNTISSINNGIYSLDEPTGGIMLTGSSNFISGNNLEDDLVGINFFGDSPTTNCSNNLIVGNTLTDCSTALLLYDSSNNTIYHNNLINNGIIFEDTGYSGFGIASLNFWDDGYPSGGNYWSDYQARYPNAKMIDDSGIGDTTYFVMPHGFVDGSGMSSSASNYWSKLNSIELKNTDHYPLMSPFDANGYYYGLRTTPPRISLLSPLNQKYNDSIVPLIFTVNKNFTWTSYSFDGQQNVTVTGNSTINNLTNGFHNLKIYANDTFGNIGSQTVNFTVEKPQLEISGNTITIIAIAVPTALVILIVGLLLFRRHRRTANLNQ